MSLTRQQAFRIWVAAMDHAQAVAAEVHKPGGRASATTENEKQKLRRIIAEHVEEETPA